MIPARFWLLALLLSLADIHAAAAQGIATWTFEWNASGVVLVFPQPVTIEGVRVPVIEDALWGRGKLGKVAALKSDHTVGVAVTGFPEQVLHGVIADAFTSRLEIIPVYAEPVIATDSAGWVSPLGSNASMPEFWKVLGSPAEQRRIEDTLRRCLHDEVEWQRRRGCFSCHRLLPLGLAVQEAWKKRIYVPVEPFRELIQNLVDWQNADGSWSFPREPRYGRLTPTLTALAVLGWWEELTPADGSDTQLRGLTFLAGRQNADGSIDYDFSFPPLFYGRTSAGWLLLNGLAFGRHEAGRNGRLFSAHLATSQEQIQNWFLRSDDLAWRKSLFTLLSRSLIPGVPSEFWYMLPDRLLGELRLLGMASDPAVSTLANLALQQEGKELLPQLVPFSERTSDALALWGLVDRLLREPSLP